MKALRMHTPAPRRTVRLLFALLMILPPARTEAQNRTAREALEWAAGGAVLGGAFAMDRVVFREVAAADSTLPSLAVAGDRLGRHRTYVPVLAALYGVGRLTGNDGLSDGALHTGGALATTALVGKTLKFLVGRARPDTPGTDADDFHPLRRSDAWASFPSGHAVTAFAMATAIREETENPWVSVLAYGTASVVGWSRVRAKRHWTSDVVAGAIVGTTVTQATMRWLHRGEPRDIGESEAMRYRWVVSFSVPGT